MSSRIDRTIRAPVAIAAVLTLAAPTLAAAQEPQPPERDREHCICFDRPSALSPTVLSRAQALVAPRARIGVGLGETERVGQQTGVRVVDATRGGPAERAGIRTGDVLLSVDGDPLGDDPADELRRRIGDSEPGHTLTIGLSRDGQPHTVRIVAEPAPWGAVFGAEGRPAPRVAPMARVEALRPGITMLMRGRDGLELVAMNEGLGRYFGTEAGVLVADAADDNRFGLRPGDVVLRVDGREPRDPAHLRSMLASYRADETATIEVMRDRRRVTVGLAGR